MKEYFLIPLIFLHFSLLQADWIVLCKNDLPIKITTERTSFEQERHVFFKAFSKSYSKNTQIMDDIKNITRMTLEKFLLKILKKEEFDWATKKNSVFFISAKTMDGKTIGYASFNENKENFHLRQLAIDPDFWGKEIGTALVFSIFTIRQKPSTISLKTRKANTSAVMFYKKIGFIFENIFPSKLEMKLYYRLKRTFSTEEIADIQKRYIIKTGS